jgi:hypothetical protein
MRCRIVALFLYFLIFCKLKQIWTIYTVFGGLQSITLRFVEQKHGGHVGGTDTLNTITADVIILLAFLEYYRCPAYSKCS